MAEFAYRTLPETWRRYRQTGVTELTKPARSRGSVSFGKPKVRPVVSSSYLEAAVRQDLDTFASGVSLSALRRQVTQAYLGYVATLTSAQCPAELRTLLSTLDTLPSPVLHAYLLALKSGRTQPQVPFCVLFDAACERYGLTLDPDVSRCLRA